MTSLLRAMTICSSSAGQTAAEERAVLAMEQLEQHSRCAAADGGGPNQHRKGQVRRSNECDHALTHLNLSRTTQLQLFAALCCRLCASQSVQDKRNESASIEHGGQGRSGAEDQAQPSPSAAEEEAATAYGEATHVAHDRSVRQRSEKARRSADSYAAESRARSVLACAPLFSTVVCARTHAGAPSLLGVTITISRWHQMQVRRRAHAPAGRKPACAPYRARGRLQPIAYPSGMPTVSQLDLTWAQLLQQTRALRPQLMQLR